MVYNTKQKKLILEYLKNAKGHVTAGEIVTHLAENGTKVGTSTVYRFLDRLLEEGGVRRFSSSEGACYQWAGDKECKNHYHFVCSRCGALLHVDCKELDRACKHIFKEHNFAVDLGNTVFCGVCEKCSSKR